MSTAVMGRAARMTGLKKPRPLKRVPEDTESQFGQDNVTDKVNLIQQRAKEFVKSSHPVQDTSECTKKDSVLPTPFHTLPPNIHAHPPEIITQHYPQVRNGFHNSNMCNETNNNIQYTTSLQDNHKGRPPGFPCPGEQQRGCRMQETCSTQDKEKRKSSSFTGTIQLGGGSSPETLVIASTCLKSLLRAANLLACHMDGELIQIDNEDDDSAEVQKKEIEVHMPRVPGLFKTNYGQRLSSSSMSCSGRSSNHSSCSNEESELEWSLVDEQDRCDPPTSSRSSSKDRTRASSTIRYSVKDLLMMAKEPYAKIAPRNWQLIKDTFPELVSHEDRYFEPFDLKACSPRALGRTRNFDINEKRCHMDIIQEFRTLGFNSNHGSRESDDFFL
ncbi:uncharacterized protein [Haliotis asinina]|uniref:uncharacterized protein n=1 Tax=Haliotis asinina TaxID=109174 RepID=UPI0035323682